MEIQRKDLPNKPLLEAIFEIHFAAKATGQGSLPSQDPLETTYPLWIGSFYEKIKARFPAHETLSPYGFPGMEGLLCNRFRSAPGEWPLIQIGPKIATLNQTASYHWEDSFLPEISGLSEAIETTHPNSDSLILDRLVLRYINGFDFSDDDGSNVLNVLNRHFDIGLTVKEKLFERLSLSRSPAGADISIDYSSLDPEGMLKIRFSNPNKDSPGMIIWEIVFSSVFRKQLLSRESLVIWAERAHEATSRAFFSLLDMDLYRSFQ